MRVLWISFVILVVDQLVKYVVQATMYVGQSVPVLGSWLKWTYTTNPGMAFGMTLGSKLFLTLFSILATALIVVYLWKIRTAHWGYRVSLALIIGGALGNIIDRTFYGVVYGYAPLFYGEVIDFFHVDLYRGTVDLPLLGPTYMALFPIWNVADMAIVVGVAAIILFQRAFTEPAAKGEPEEEEPAEVPADAPVAFAPVAARE